MGIGISMFNYCGSSIVADTLHAMRNCPIGMSLGLNVVPLISQYIFFIGDLNSWISLNVSNNDVKVE